MLTFIDHIVCLVKQTHNQFMNGFDIIKSLGGFYQTLLLQDSWIFRWKAYGFNILGTFFWHKKHKMPWIKKLWDKMIFILLTFWIGFELFHK